MKKLILFVGSPLTVNSLQVSVPRGYVAEIASTPSVAMDHLSSAGTFEAIVIVPKLGESPDDFNTGGIIAFAVKKGFRFIIGASKSARVRVCMRQAGCTHYYNNDLDAGVIDLITQLVPVSG
jgi:hypothetical protein